MELENDAPLFFDCMFYVKDVKNNRELCKVCMTEEETDTPWDRYQLKCGHMMHTRCYRTWCSVKQSVVCPYCGPVPDEPQWRFCDGCHNFGHNVCVDGYKSCRPRKCKKKKN